MAGWASHECNSSKLGILSIFQNQYAANYHMITNACSNHGGVFDYVVARALEIYVNIKLWYCHF